MQVKGIVLLAIVCLMNKSVVQGQEGYVVEMPNAIIQNKIMRQGMAADVKDCTTTIVVTVTASGNPLPTGDNSQGSSNDNNNTSTDINNNTSTDINNSPGSSTNNNSNTDTNTNNNPSSSNNNNDSNTDNNTAISSTLPYCDDDDGSSDCSDPSSDDSMSDDGIGSDLISIVDSLDSDSSSDTTTDSGVSKACVRVYMTAAMVILLTTVPFF